MKRFSIFFAFLMTVLFVWAAFVQLNDPDPQIWIPIYGTAALGSVFFLAGKLKSWVALLFAVSFLVGALLYWPDQFEGVDFGEQGMANHNIERGRESLGLGIAALVFLFYSWRLGRSR
ncbi:MAG: hypothetical protein RLZZ241_1354 [Bacteroidota bacterium]|jgi:hypothetical protein